MIFLLSNKKLIVFYEWLVRKDVSKLFHSLTPGIMSVSEFKDHIYESTLVNVTGPDGNIYGMPFHRIYPNIPGEYLVSASCGDFGFILDGILSIKGPRAVNGHLKPAELKTDQSKK